MVRGGGNECIDQIVMVPDKPLKGNQELRWDMIDKVTY